jgi:hypothetical protein
MRRSGVSSADRTAGDARGGGSPSRRGLVAALLLVALAGAANAGSKVPYGGAFREEIEATFFELVGGDLGGVSPAKVRAYRDFIEKKLRALETHVYNHETIDRGRSAAEAKKRIRRLDTTIALEHILHLLDRMERTNDPVVSYDIAAETLMVEYATRSYTDPLGSIKIPMHIKNMIFEWRVDNASRPRAAAKEATNLVDPETGEFYTPDELAALTRAGFDLSTLDPPRETFFWRARKDISQVDVIENYLNGGDPMHAGIVSRFPEFDGAEFEIDKAHKTQSKPKLDVFHLDEDCRKKSKKKRKKCRRKLKLKFGMETHADPPANALLSTLGFNADVSMHLKNVRVNLGKHSRVDVEKDWIGYFDRQRLHTYFPIETVLHEGDAGRGRDAKGEYFVFKETVAELKPGELDRIGMFSFSWGLAAEWREARGLFLFNAWIANADMKDEENNKLILRKSADGERKMYLVQQDIGHSLGWVLPERPEAFPWDLVEARGVAGLFGWANGSIELNYINLQDTGLEHTTTYADAKWMARLIAQLTRKQIEDAVSLGHWPGGIAQLYVEKLINRRNQLVQAFDLEGEFELMPVDRHITTADGSVVDGHLTRNRWDESPINFDHHWPDTLGPAGMWLVDRTVEGLQTVIAAIDVINPGNIRITGKLLVFPRVLVQLSREVIFNPEPEGAFDQYIVVDSMHVGVRGGIGYIGSAEGTVIKKYALAFPVATRRAGIHAGIGVANFLLPYDVRKGKLPEKYVLYREHAFKAGVRLSSDHSPFLSPFGVDADQNWVLAHRSVIDHRKENPILWVDRPKSLERDAHMFLELAVLQIPFLGGNTSDGSVAGEVWTIDGTKKGVTGDDGVPIFDRMVQKGDFREAGKILLADRRRASSDFRSREVWWNLLFATWRSRASEEKITLMDAAGRPTREERQAERRKRFTWSFLDNGETHEFRVTGFLGAVDASGGVREKPIVVISYSVDDLNTHSDEFDSYYDLLKGIGAGQTYLAEEFEAADWEVSGEPGGRWTRLQTEGVVHLHTEALARLTRLDEAEYWRLLAKNLGMSERDLERHRALVRPSTSKDTLVARRSLAGRPIRSVIRRSLTVLDKLEKAHEAASEAERLRLLVEAVYRSSFRSGGTFNPVILATLLEQSGVAELIERDEIAIKARVSKAFEDEHNLPERRDVVGRLGREKDFAQIRYRFFPFGGIELYNMLNWVSETE